MAQVSCFTARFRSQLRGAAEAKAGTDALRTHFRLPHFGVESARLAAGEARLGWMPTMEAVGRLTFQIRRSHPSDLSERSRRVLHWIRMRLLYAS